MSKLYRIGSTGDDVKKIQQKLGLKSDGIFGENTRIAVTNFQRSNGLKSDGIVGPNTWNLLFKNVSTKNLYSFGSTGDDVKKIQQKLGLKPDGIFGENTRIAVTNFQRSNGLKSDGIVGPNTWNLLFKRVDNIKNGEVPVTKKTPKAVKKGDIVSTANKVIETYQKNGVKYSQSKRQFGLNAKFSDCSSAVNTILSEAGLVDRLSSTNTRAMRSEIMAKGGSFRKDNPLPGDIMMWGGHVTIVTKIEGGFIHFAHMGVSGPRIGRVRLSGNKLPSENVWGAGGFIGFWTIS
jgi:peptidoglycan hydrolase-like protein with peptidoglycan-binding domain